MNYLEWLNPSYSSSRINFGLERMTKLLGILGNPERKLRFIHITGTNGKGSICAMVASILHTAGYQVGMYTSPHLVRYNERIRVNGEEISDSDLNRFAEYIYSYANALGLTSFEATTAIAILYFLEKKVDFVVFEVGLGGRLDATNVVTPLASIITTIDLEHTDFLGDTIEKIAYEKAGIIKPGIPVITGTEGKAFEIISTIARERGSNVITASICPYPTNLVGDFQKKNSAIAYHTIKILQQNYGILVPEEAIKSGLVSVCWPGRMDFIEKNILIDVAHNPQGFRALKAELLKMSYERLILVIGILRDKDSKVMLDELASLASKIIFCSPNTDRALPAHYLASQIKHQNVELIPDVATAFERGKSILQKGDLLLITGSLYTAGEVYTYLVHFKRLKPC